jgi:pre-mRNA-splicing factor CDC5/CEF1
MLSEAKRLASLQKRRELKAAGIEFKMREKKRKFIDYVNEIPFQRVVSAATLPFPSHG